MMVITCTVYLRRRRKKEENRMKEKESIYLFPW